MKANHERKKLVKQNYSKAIALQKLFPWQCASVTSDMKLNIIIYSFSITCNYAKCDIFTAKNELLPASDAPGSAKLCPEGYFYWKIWINKCWEENYINLMERINVDVNYVIKMRKRLLKSFITSCIALCRFCFCTSFDVNCFWAIVWNNGFGMVQFKKIQTRSLILNLSPSSVQIFTMVFMMWSRCVPP